MKTFEGVIFDIDGTLLNSNDAHARAYQQALKASGHSHSYEEVRRLIGMGGDNLLPTLTGIQEDSTEGKTISEKKKQLFEQQFLSTLEPFPRAKDLIRALKDRGLRIAVASSAKEEELKLFLRIIGIEDLIETKTSSSDAESSKPDPDIILAALQRLQLSPEQVMMVGDTPYDIEAAKRAGVKTLAVKCGGWDEKGLRDAFKIYESPEDLLRNLDTSPLFQGPRAKAVA